MLSEVQTELAVCKDQVSQLESAIGDLKLVKLQLSSELEAEKLSKEAAVNDHMATIADLELTNKTQQETCSSLQCENDCLVEEKSRLQTKLHEEMECLAELRETILGMEKAGKNDRAQWNEEKSNLQSDIVDLQATVKGLEATQSSYMQELEVQSQSAAQMQIDKDKLKASYEEIVEEARTMAQQKVDMERSIEDKMATILHLQLANQKQEEECTNLKEQGDNFAEQIASLESSLEERDRCVAEMKQQSAELQRSIEQNEVQWEEEKAVWESSNVNLQAKLEQSVKETREKEQSVASLNHSLTKLKDEHEKLQVSREEMLADVKTLNEQRLLSEKTIADHLATILDLQQDNKTQLDLYSKLECEKSCLERDKTNIQTQFQNTKEELMQKILDIESAGKTNNAQWQAERTAFESHVAELQTAITHLEANESRCRQEIESQNQTVAQLQKELGEVKVSYKQSVKEIEALTENKLAMEKEIKDNMATISTLESANKRQIEECNNLNNQRDNAVKEISNLEHKLETEAKSVAELTQKVAELQASMENHQVQCSEEKTAQESTIVDLQRKLDISVKEALEKDQTVDSLNQHLTDIQDKHEKLQASYEKTLQTCSELQKEKDQAGLHQLESLLHTHKMQSEQLLQAKLQNKEIELPLKQGNTQQQKTIDELQNDNSRLATAWKTMQEKCVSLEKANKELKQKLSGYNEIMEILDRYRVSSCSDCSLCLQYK